MLRLRKLGTKLHQAWPTLALVAGLSLGLGAGLDAHAKQAGSDSLTGQAVISAAELPPQGREVMAQIATGGPFKYEKDGTVFGNRERLLPRQTRGYYREYTVKTPGERTRGARRIVCGGAVPKTPDACYYTSDHYASFRKIAP
jgi:ribonuclease T1